MLYVKTQITNNLEIKVDLHENEIYTTCPGCEKEVQVEPEHLVQIITDCDNFSETSMYCDICSEKIILSKK